MWLDGSTARRESIQLDTVVSSFPASVETDPLVPYSFSIFSASKSYVSFLVPRLRTRVVRVMALAVKIITADFPSSTSFRFYRSPASSNRFSRFSALLEISSHRAIVSSNERTRRGIDRRAIDPRRRRDQLVQRIPEAPSQIPPCPRPSFRLSLFFFPPFRSASYQFPSFSLKIRQPISLGSPRAERRRPRYKAGDLSRRLI